MYVIMANQETYYNKKTKTFWYDGKKATKYKTKKWAQIIINNLQPEIYYFGRKEIDDDFLTIEKVSDGNGNTKH